MELYITMGVAVVLQVLRDPRLKQTWRRALLKIFKEIATQFRDDPDFAAVINRQEV